MTKSDTPKKTSTETSKTEGAVKAKTKASASIPKKATTPRKEAAPSEFKKEITFSLHAPHATRACVVGCFNKWDTTANPMKRNGQGMWQCTVAVRSGEHQYRFIVDESWWSDPANPMKCWNEFGTQNSILIV